MDGSGRITIRNRKILRKYAPVHQDDRHRCILDDLTYLPTGNSPGQPSAPTTPADVSPQPSVPLLSASPKAPNSPPPDDSPLLTAQLCHRILPDHHLSRLLLPLLQPHLH